MLEIAGHFAAEIGEVGVTRFGEQGVEAEMAARENADSLEKLKDEAGNAASRQWDLERDLNKTTNDVDEEEKARRLAELEALMKQKDDLAAIERSLDETTGKMTEWKEFAWTEEQEAELQQYGMISSLANPSFPLHLIKDPDLLALIMKRRQELLETARELLGTESFNTVAVKQETERGGLFPDQQDQETEALNESLYRLPQCHVSVSTKSLVDFAYNTLAEMSEEEPDVTVASESSSE